MKIVVRAVTKGPGGHDLPETSVTFASGQAVLARAETELRPTVLGLIASGRMRPDSGSVTIDGAADAAQLRRRVALIDAPEVCEPSPGVTVAGVVAEELMFAGRRSHPGAVQRWLDSLGYGSYARRAIGTVAPSVRVRILLELALLRSGVDGVVLTAPDRHGGDPGDWWAIAREIAARGVAVLVIAGDASAAAIGAAGLVERLGQTTSSAADFDDPTVDDTDTIDLPQTGHTVPRSDESNDA
jgi:hypothetical protein